MTWINLNIIIIMKSILLWKPFTNMNLGNCGFLWTGFGDTMHVKNLTIRDNCFSVFASKYIVEHFLCVHRYDLWRWRRFMYDKKFVFLSSYMIHASPHYEQYSFKHYICPFTMVFLIQTKQNLRLSLVCENVDD